MDKIAQLKHAEVAGVISGLIDGGYLKLASDQEFEALTEAVAGNISNDWDLGEVLDKTAEIMDGGMDKTAEETLYDAFADYGYLCLAKEAGEISNIEFAKEAADLTAIIGDALRSANAAAGPAVMKGIGKARDAAKWVGEAGSAQKARDVYRGLGYFDQNAKVIGMKHLMKAMKDPAKLYGGGAAGVAGLYGLNKLRDKDTRDAIAKKFKAGKKAILG